MTRANDYLLIDVSNSFTKLAFASRKRIARPVRVETARLTSASLRAFVKNRKIDKFIVSSVVPKKNREIKKAAGKTKILWLDAKVNLGVGIDYPAPKTIGADRLANAAAVTALYGWPAVVVDFGTAVTFDIISKQKKYIGGVIAPGLEAMTNFLYQRTALLPKLSLKEPRSALGRSTIDAMRSGAIFGYRGLVREILARIKAERFPRGRLKVVATGGYAHLIASRLLEVDAIHPNLTLEGLRIAGNLNS
jgi:type III pantothenate kinase